MHVSGVLACDEAEVVVGAARRAGRKPTSTLIVDIGDEDDLLTVVRDLRVEGRDAARLLVTARALEPIEHAAGAERLRRTRTLATRLPRGRGARLGHALSRACRRVITGWRLIGIKGGEGVHTSRPTTAEMLGGTVTRVVIPRSRSYRKMLASVTGRRESCVPKAVAVWKLVVYATKRPAASMLGLSDPTPIVFTPVWRPTAAKKGHIAEVTLTPLAVRSYIESSPQYSWSFARRSALLAEEPAHALLPSVLSSANMESLLAARSYSQPSSSPVLSGW